MCVGWDLILPVITLGGECVVGQFSLTTKCVVCSIKSGLAMAGTMPFKGTVQLSSLSISYDMS